MAKGTVESSNPARPGSFVWFVVYSEVIAKHLSNCLSLGVQSRTRLLCEAAPDGRPRFAHTIRFSVAVFELRPGVSVTESLRALQLSASAVPQVSSGPSFSQ
jgi:hypothetical protein